MDAHPLSLTGHELVMLLSMADTPGAIASRRVLEYADEDRSPEMQLLGLSSLVARGLATLDDETATPVGHALHVAAALSTAATWMRVVVAGEDKLAVYVVAVGPSAGVALRSRELGIYDVTPVDPATDLGQLGIAVVDEVLSSAGLPAVATVRLDEADPLLWRSASIRAEADAPWQVVGPQRESGQEATAHAAEEAEARQAWAALVRAL